MWTGAPAPNQAGFYCAKQDALSKEGLEGEQSPRKDRVFNIGNDVQHHGLFDGGTPGSRKNGKQVTAAVTQCGCRGGEFFEGCDSRCGNPLASTLLHARMECADLRVGFGERARETQRTPGSAVGCNKPTTGKAAEAIEVVQNHKDGTKPREGSLCSKCGGNIAWEWTLFGMSKEG